MIIIVNPEEYLERTIGFTIKYKREDPYDQREVSEFPEIRLWYVRLDATYPWLPLLLDWRAGELARYTAMLVPHQVTYIILSRIPIKDILIDNVLYSSTCYRFGDQCLFCVCMYYVDEYENGSGVQPRGVGIVHHE